MPRYYFDPWDGGDLFVDQSGLDLASLADATSEAARALTEIISPDLPDRGLSKTSSLEFGPEKIF